MSIPAIPARYTTLPYPVVFQKFTITRIHGQYFGFEYQSTPSNPSAGIRLLFIRPFSTWRNASTRKLTITYDKKCGIITTVWHSFETALFLNSESPIAIATLNTRPPKINNKLYAIVFLVITHASGLLNMNSKFLSPFHGLAHIPRS